MIRLIQKIMLKADEIKQKNERKRDELKQSIVKQLSTPTTKAEIINYNLDALSKTGNCFGGKYTEYNIKHDLLCNNIYLFTDEETRDLLKLIETNSDRTFTMF